MPVHHRSIHPQETYRFSMTQTLSDYPLLIGEILRRDELRAFHQARRRAFFDGLQRVFGIRVPRAVGVPKLPSTDADWSEQQDQ